MCAASKAAFSSALECTSLSPCEKKTVDNNFSASPASNMGLNRGSAVCSLEGANRLVRVCALGKYYRPDLNFPCSLPQRSHGLKGFENDPPLSSCGIFQARTAGKLECLSSGISNNNGWQWLSLMCTEPSLPVL